jgi:hypothetical protein
LNALLRYAQWISFPFRSSAAISPSCFQGAGDRHGGFANHNTTPHREATRKSLPRDLCVSSGAHPAQQEADDLARRPEHKMRGWSSAYGLLGGDPNAPGPTKRQMSSMSPTLVFKDGKLVMGIVTSSVFTAPRTGSN